MCIWKELIRTRPPLPPSLPLYTPESITARSSFSDSDWVVNNHRTRHFISGLFSHTVFLSVATKLNILLTHSQHCITHFFKKTSFSIHTSVLKTLHIFTRNLRFSESAFFYSLALYIKYIFLDVKMILIIMSTKSSSSSELPTAQLIFLPRMVPKNQDMKKFTEYS